jgi:hypothetical protein
MYCVSWHSSFLCSAVFRREMLFVDSVWVTCVPVAITFLKYTHAISIPSV